MAQAQHSCSPLLAWIESALRAERHAVDLALALRHVAFLKELAPHLEGLQWRPAPSAKLQLEYSAIVTTKSADRGVSNSKQFSAEQPLQGLRDLCPPQTPSSICSLELHDNDEQDLVLADQDLQGLQSLQQQQPQQLTVFAKDEEVAIVASLKRSPAARGLEVLKQVEQVVQDELSIGSARSNHTKDDEVSFTEKIRRRVRKLLNNRLFETGVSCIIVANSLCMGLETSFEVQGHDATPFQILEHFFLAVYMFELSLRFCVDGWSCLKNSWVAFDFALVCTGALSLYVIGPILSSLSTSNNESMQDSMAGLLVMRMLRLFRLARAIRFLVIFKTLWLLVSGLIGSAGTIAYTFGLIMLILYIFSVMALELITKRLRHSDSPPEVQTLIQTRFPNLMTTMLTLLQFVSMDSISSLYFPLIMHDPFVMVFFIPFIMVVSICLMNLVTAVIVEAAIEQGKEDREAQIRYRQYRFQKILPSLKQMFHELDIDGNGTVTLSELQHAPQELQEKLEQVMKADSLTELFEMVDVDESGECSIEEFCDGIAKLIHSDSPVEFTRILKQLAFLRRQMGELQTVTMRIQANGAVTADNEDLRGALK